MRFGAASARHGHQAGPHERAGDLRLYHRGLSAQEPEQRQDELGDAAEADGEQAADGRPDPVGELIGGASDPLRQDGDGQRAGGEGQERRGPDEVLQPRRDRDEDEKDGEDRSRQTRADAAGVVSQPARSVRRATIPSVEPWTMMVKSTTA